MTPQRRREMGEAAVAAAHAIGYSGAGTVEFIAEQDGRFYFMEMNTRLQAEHPVTEMITGLDLVEWQLRVAAGERLPLLQDELSFSGHAIEARIYAEDPERDFLPATGKLLDLAFPGETHDVRIDAGVDAGGEITPWYDPMIAKLIVRGPDRDTALARLRRALAETEIAGVTTNVAFLGRVAAGRASAWRDAASRRARYATAASGTCSATAATGGSRSRRSCRRRRTPRRRARSPRPCPGR